MRSCDKHRRVISHQMPQPSITKFSFKITYLKFCSNLPRANELRLMTSEWEQNWSYVKYLTLQQVGNFFFQNVILLSNDILYACNISIWNWSDTMNIKSAQWIMMVRGFRTSTSVSTVLKLEKQILCVEANSWPSDISFDDRLIIQICIYVVIHDGDMLSWKAPLLLQ